MWVGIRCAVAVVAVSIASFSARTWASGVDTNDPSLPPNIGAYLSPQDVHTTYSGPGLVVVLQNIQHKPFAETTVRTPVGPHEQEEFDSRADGEASVNGSPFFPITMTGPVTTMVFNKIGNTTGTFQTEMLAMNLTGAGPGGPVMVREGPNPGPPSQGQTSITDIGGGLYHIDSFFDVFTELSLDGGNTWIPSDGPTHVTLEPEPGAFSLVALAALVGSLRRRRSSAL